MKDVYSIPFSVSVLSGEKSMFCGTVELSNISTLISVGWNTKLKWSQARDTKPVIKTCLKYYTGKKTCAKFSSSQSVFCSASCLSIALLQYFNQISINVRMECGSA